MTQSYGMFGATIVLASGRNFLNVGGRAGENRIWLREIKLFLRFWRLLEWYNDSGHLQKCKSRLCIRGYRMSSEDNNFDFSFSSTVSYDQVRLIAALCATSDKDLFTADVRRAYLSVERKQKEGCRKLWLQPPKGYEHPEDKSMCLEIKAALYGLRDSARF